MRKLIIGLAAVGSVLAIVPAASARDGCGRGFHRGYYGRCVPNGPRYVPAPRYVAPGPSVRLVIGNYYHGRGYWDGRRYWQNRERWRGGWRYR